MALTLNAADNVGFGDIAGIGGLTEMTIAVTLLRTDAVSNARIVSEWGGGATDRAFVLQGIDNDELGLVVQAAGVAFGRRTLGLDLGAGDLVRGVYTWKAGEPVADSIEFWVNGVKQTSRSWIGGVNPAALIDSTLPVDVGRDTSTPSDGMDADWSEFAIWDHRVPDWVAIAYGKGMSPRFYRRGGILYAPLWNTGYLLDQWGGVTGTESGAANAAHPRIYYPAPSPLVIGLEPPPPPHVSPPHIDDGTVTIKATDDASVSIGADDDSVSIREKEAAVV